MMVDLRCPECFMWMQECCTRGELAELDKRQAAWRELIVDAYERSVTESWRRSPCASAPRSRSTSSAPTTSRRGARRAPERRDGAASPLACSAPEREQREPQRRRRRADAAAGSARDGGGTARSAPEPSRCSAAGVARRGRASGVARRSTACPAASIRATRSASAPARTGSGPPTCGEHVLAHGERRRVGEHVARRDTTAAAVPSARRVQRAVPKRR